MASGNPDFMEALGKGDLVFLKDYLRRNPQESQAKLKWGNYDGLPVNYAAFCNQPAVVEFLCLEYAADVNRNDGVGSGWTPLHHAQEKNAYAAAAMLLAQGADPSRGNGKGEDTTAFCAKEEVRICRDPRYAERKKRLAQEAADRKAAGTWTRTGPREVVHDHELPGSGYRLTDVFNFETRCWRALVKDLNGGVTQSLVFFDDLPDTAPIRPALAKLRELGGAAADEEIDGGKLLKKLRKPGLR